VLLELYTSKDIAAIAVCSALWGVLNAWLSPIVWQLTHLPFLCDMLAFMALILVIWWTRKFGAASLVGLIAAAMTLMVTPTAFQMLGFVIASIVFDIVTRFLGYENLFKNLTWGAMMLLVISVLCAGLAGTIIGASLMGFKTLQAVLAFGGLHAIGGLIGAIFGVVAVKALVARRVKTI
jgi:hypothetical protein